MVAKKRVRRDPLIPGLEWAVGLAETYALAVAGSTRTQRDVRFETAKEVADTLRKVLKHHQASQRQSVEPTKGTSK